MTLQEFIRESFTVNWEWMERYVDGLTQAEIEFRPNDQCHSIGFILWHYGRALDMWVQTFARRDTQLYLQGWAERLGFAPEPMAVGFGYSAEDLANWRCPEKEPVLAYASAARENLLAFLGQHDDVSLGSTEMTNRQGQTIKLADMFRILIWEVNQHGGQASYLRGMQRGLGQ